METTASPRPGDPGPSLVGRLLDGRYRLDSIIDRGGMATVYLAIDTRLDRIVAVKVMHRNLAEDPEFVARFTREAQSAAKVAGPEVVAVHDTGTDPETGLAYLVMEHVRGQNLRQLIKAVGAMPPARAIALIEPVLKALAAAHEAGLIHRDIKPENVLVGDNGRVKVADFGLARAIESTNITRVGGDLIGTANYLAPEQSSSGSGSERSDVYAAGVVLWELLTGSPPFAGGTEVEVAVKHHVQDVPAPSTIVSGIPPALDALVVRATRRDPAERPANGAAFLRELHAVAAGQPVPTPAPADPNRTLVVPRVATAPVAAAHPKRRRRGLIAVLVIALLGAVALGGGYYLGSYRYTHAPSVLKLTLAKATVKLKAEHLKIRQGPSKFSETVAANLVLEQDPAPTKKVRKDATVTVYLSKGPDRRGVPSLAGLSLADATNALKHAGLAVAPAPAHVYSGSVPAGDVISSDPPSGAKLKPGTAVALTVSQGPQPVPVPNLQGKKAKDAERILTGLGFRYTLTQVFSDTVAKDTVISSAPSSGTAAKGSAVALTVSKGPDVVTVPGVHFKSVADATRILTNLGFKVQVHRLDGGPGRVIDQSPGGGSSRKRGSTVQLYVF